MRILIDHSGYELRNLGDAAMLQVCLDRIRAVHPDADIDVVTIDAQRLEQYCPGTRPVRSTLVDRQPFRSLPRSPRLAVEQVWKAGSPYLLRGRGDTCPDTEKNKGSASILDAIRSADVVVAAGGGYLTDIWWWHALGVLSVVAAAQRLGKRTAMFGQGLGPLTHPLVRRQARIVLPRLEVLGLREGLIGPPLARELGVHPGRVVVTGDDALPLAVGGKVPAAGSRLGVNIRIADYTNLDAGTTSMLRRVLGDAATALDAELLGLPVSRYSAGDDLDDIRALLSTAAPHRVELPDLTTPQALADAAASCRAVVTASYHAAVFALAAGVPTVCLTRSPYYDGKFGGLAALFPEAVTVVTMTGSGLEGRLFQAISKAWTVPEGLRAETRARAVAQVSTSAEVYDRFLRGTRIPAGTTT